MWAFTQNWDYCILPIFFNRFWLLGNYDTITSFLVSLPPSLLCSLSHDVCVCVCVHVREREREREMLWLNEIQYFMYMYIKLYISTDYPHHENTNRYFNPTRRKRHSSKRISRGVREKSVEILVVVDKYVYWKHGRQNITTYVLSIFNIVSQILVFSEFLIKLINLNWEKSTRLPRDSLCFAGISVVSGQFFKL